MAPARTVEIDSQLAVERAGHAARDVARAQRLDPNETAGLLVSVSELATNLLRYAPGGRLTVFAIDEGARRGVGVSSIDCGIGIGDVGLAVQDGFSTSGGLGSGLAVVRRQMDEFEIASSPEGTMVLARKWHHNR